MCSGDDPALSISPGTGIDFIGPVGIDLCKEQSGQPAPDGMAGGITAFATQLGILARGGGFLEVFKGAQAVEIGFRSHTDGVNCLQTVFQKPPDLRCRFFRDGQPKSGRQLPDKGVIRPDGIAPRHFQTGRVLALLFSPFIALNVVFERRCALLWRSRKAFYQIRKVGRRQVGFLR